MAVPAGGPINGIFGRLTCTNTRAKHVKVLKIPMSKCSFRTKYAKSQIYWFEIFQADVVSLL